VKAARPLSLCAVGSVDQVVARRNLECQGRRLPVQMVLEVLCDSADYLREPLFVSDVTFRRQIKVQQEQRVAVS